MSQGQTTVLQEFPVPFAGQIDNSSADPKIRTLLNKTGGSLNAGIAVKVNPAPSATQPGGVGGSSGSDEAVLLSATTDDIAGVTSLDMSTDPDNLAGSYSFHEGVVMPCLEDGDIWVLQDQAVSVGDPVYVRFAAGTGTVNTPGAFGNSADAGTCRLVAGATWKNAGSGVAGSPALLRIDVLTDKATH